jgi:hypothetical protein
MGVRVDLGGRTIPVFNNIAFDAANFTASAGTWTFPNGAADQLNFQSVTIGRLVGIFFQTSTETTLSANTLTMLVRIPFTVASDWGTIGPRQFLAQNQQTTPCWVGTTGGNQLLLNRQVGNWSLGLIQVGFSYWFKRA